MLKFNRFQSKIKLICLMPTYNKQETLSVAIESVMMQKTDFPYKLIILDDCSTDNSNKIAREFKSKYPDKIAIVKNRKNLKLLRSIMNGYSLLRGCDYFCVLDADDYYTYDKKFADAIDYLDTHPDDTMYMTNVIVKRRDSSKLMYNGRDKINHFNYSDLKENKGIFMQTSGVIYRNIYFKFGKNKEFARVLKLTFPQCFRADGFRFYWYLRGGGAIFINKCESIYNYTDNGIWSSMNDIEQILIKAELFFSCMEFFSDDEDFYTQKILLLLQEVREQLENSANDMQDKYNKRISIIETALDKYFNRKSSFVPNKRSFINKLQYKL